MGDQLSQVNEVVANAVKASTEQLVPVLASKISQQLPAMVKTVVAQAIATEVSRQEAQSVALRASTPSFAPTPTFSVPPPTLPAAQLYELPEYEPIPNFMDHFQPEGSAGPSTLVGDAGLFALPESPPDATIEGFFVKQVGTQLCYRKWCYERLRTNFELLEALSPEIASIASIMDERKSKQVVVPGRLSLPAEDEPSRFTLTGHASLPSAPTLFHSTFAMPLSPAPSLPASGSALPILTASPAAALSNVPASGGASLSVPASSGALLPTMSTPNSKSELSQEIKQFDRIAFS